jgi:hypothetical protein
MVFILFVIAIIMNTVRLFTVAALNMVSVEKTDVLIAIAMPLFLFVAIGLPTLFFKFSDGKETIFRWCCPKAVLQAHAGWHILSALLVLVAYDLFATFGKDGSIFSVSD